MPGPAPGVGGMGPPFARMAGDPSDTTLPTPGAGWATVRQNLPAVTRAGMPCFARAWRTELGLITCDPFRVSVVAPSGLVTTENAARWIGGALCCGAGPAEPWAPARPATSAAHAPAPAMDSPPRRRRRRARP